MSEYETFKNALLRIAPHDKKRNLSFVYDDLYRKDCLRPYCDKHLNYSDGSTYGSIIILHFNSAEELTYAEGWGE